MTMPAGASEPRLGWDPAPQRGWVSPHIAAEFPGLGVAWVEVEARPGRSGDSVRRRLRDLSDRFFGSHAIRLRERPIPWAYRVFFRQIGLDPDRTRTPVEQLALDRLQDGAFRSRGLPSDALTIATVETGVALRAFDADRLEGRLCIRDSAPGESLAGRPGELAAGDADPGRRLRPGRPPLRRHRRGLRRRPRQPPHRGRRDRGQRGAADRGRGGALDGGVGTECR